jgi:hypothetical protein
VFNLLSLQALATLALIRKKASYRFQGLSVGRIINVGPRKKNFSKIAQKGELARKPRGINVQRSNACHTARNTLYGIEICIV